MAQWLTNLTRNPEVAVGSLALLSGLRIRCGRELWCGSQTLLGSLWCRLVATALIRPLVWELPYAMSMALKKQKAKSKKIKEDQLKINV